MYVRQSWCCRSAGTWGRPRRAADDGTLDRAELACDQRGVAERADPDRQVIAIADNVDIAIVQVELDVEMRMLSREGRQGRKNVQRSQIGGRRHPHEPARRRGADTDGVDSFIEIVQQAPRALLEAGAQGGQCDGMGGPADQLRIEAVLQ